MSLVTGAASALRGNRGIGVIVPLGAVTVIGSIVEPVIASRNPVASNIIGGIILALAIVRIELLVPPRKRT